MKFIFLGDIEFGRDKDRHCSLFLSKDIIQLLNSNDAIFFNLETVLVSKDFHFCSFDVQGIDSLAPIFIYLIIIYK